MSAGGGGENFFARALQQMIIFQIPAQRLQVGIAFFVRPAVRIAEDVVFQLGRGVYNIAQVVGCVDLSAQDAAWRNGNRLMRAFIFQIAEHNGGLF